MTPKLFLCKVHGTKHKELLNYLYARCFHHNLCDEHRAFARRNQNHKDYISFHVFEVLGHDTTYYHPRNAEELKGLLPLGPSLYKNDYSNFFLEFYLDDVQIVFGNENNQPSFEFSVLSLDS